MVRINNYQGQWWKGEITVSYNLKTVLKWIIALAFLALGLLILYGVIVGGIALVKVLYGWGCDLWAWGTANWWWPLGILLAALLAWLLSKINWRSEKTKANVKRWWWILPLVLLLILAAMLFRSCGDDNNSVAPIEKQEIEAVTVEKFDRAFDWVVIARAYLDGVQHGNTKTARALVGLKFIDGPPVSEKTFEGKTYDEAVKVIAEDWRELVTSSLKGQKLSEQQLVVITLFAMRNGKFGYLQSEFLKAVQKGHLFGASDKMYLHKSNGNRRHLLEEGKQYLWMLKILWDGKIDVKELIDMPMFSYKNIRANEMYDGDQHLWIQSFRSRLKKGNNQTPRQALGL